MNPENPEPDETETALRHQVEDEKSRSGGFISGFSLPVMPSCDQLDSHQKHRHGATTIAESGNTSKQLGVHLRFQGRIAVFVCVCVCVCVCLSVCLCVCLPVCVCVSVGRLVNAFSSLQVQGCCFAAEAAEDGDRTPAASAGKEQDAADEGL